MQDIRKKQLFLAGITVAALAPFLNKAFHIDDPLFLWIAQQITHHPFDPYGFGVVWGESSMRPMWQNMLNPPLCSYFIALIASVAGWSEIALHSAFVLFSIAAVLGTFALARRFCVNPVTAALLTLFTPVFLVSATNVMCDVMLLALWVWTIECWLAGLDRGRPRLLILAAVLASAAMLTKYFGISVVPLLAVYTIVRKSRSWWYLAFLAIPILATLAYEFFTRNAYGHAMFSGATSYLIPISGYGAALPTQFVTGLVFAGGCLFGAISFAPIRNWRFLPIAAVVLAIAILSFRIFVSVPPEAAANHTIVWVEGALFIALGVWILALAIVDLARQRTADSLLLLMWIAGTFVFAAFVNWAITARTILPMAPAVAILLTRQFDNPGLPRRLIWLGVSCAAVISLLVTTADFRLANAGRAASQHFRQKFGAESNTVWFHGHWGFQYYMEQWGAKPLTTDAKTSPNGVMIIAESYPDDPSVTDRKIITASRVSFSALPFLATFSRGAGAGFYSHGVGPLPWAIDRVPPETYYVARLAD